MFQGRFAHTVDTKGRTSIPSKFREVLAANYDERLILTNMDGALSAYPASEWQIIVNKVAEKPQFREDIKALQRFFISAATECPVDKQGRIVIPPTLRDYAALKKDIVLLGLTRKIEIWSKERWEEISPKMEKKISEGGLSDLGL